MNKIPITKPYIGKEETEAVSSVLSSGWLVQGAKVKEFEERVAEHEQVKYCCATTSCTTALQLAMLSEGLTVGMDAIVPSFTFVATANAVLSTGAVPILTDIDQDTYNISPAAVEAYVETHYMWQDDSLINKESGNRLWGIVPVHQFGLCADMSALNGLAQKYNIKIIEDGACALGAKIEGVHIGGFGHTVCVSFHPRKSITTGEGGMILTNDEEVYQKAVVLRNHGSLTASDQRHKSEGYLLPGYAEAGYNYRMTDIQGAIGCEQMKKLDDILARRRELSEKYETLLAGKSPVLKLPYVPQGYYHTYQSYVCRLDFSGNTTQISSRRNEVMRCLEKAGIATRQGTHAVHKLEYYKRRFEWQDSDLPMADRCDAATVSLPLFVSMTPEEQKTVAAYLLKYVGD